MSATGTVAAILLNPEAKKMAAKKTAKKTAKKNPARKRATRKHAAKRNPSKRRRARRRHNPTVGGAMLTAAKAVGGVLVGAVVGGGAFYLVRDLDLNPAIPGAVALLGGGALAGIGPIDTVFSACAGGMIATIGVGQVAAGIVGVKAEKVAPAVDQRTMLPTAHGMFPGQVDAALVDQVKGIEVPGLHAYNGDYSGIEVPFDGLQVPYEGIEVPEGIG